MQKLLVVLLSVLLLVNGHAVLKSPKPWNTAPSKSNPCGGGAAPTQAAAVWVVGSKVNVQWQVVAGDGQGAVTVTINGDGGTTFTGQGTNVGNGNSVTTFDFAFTVPNVQCNGPNGLCSVQVKSSSNWFSCTSVKINAAGTPTPAPAPVPAPVPVPVPATKAASSAQPATSAQAASTAQQQSTAKPATSAQAASTAQQQPATSAQQSTRQQQQTSKQPVASSAAPAPVDNGVAVATCAVLTDLKFCSMGNGNNISISSGDNPANIDAAARLTFTETLNNDAVFSTPKATGCEEAFKNLVCGNAFPICGAGVACQPDCNLAINLCGLQDSHKGLFDCSKGNTECLRPKAVGNAPTAGETASDVSKIVVGASLLLALLM